MIGRKEMDADEGVCMQIGPEWQDYVQAAPRRGGSPCLIYTEYERTGERARVKAMQGGGWICGRVE